MIKGTIHKLVQDNIDSIMSKTPYSLTQEQEKLVKLICQEVIMNISEDIRKDSPDETITAKLEKIQTTWKLLNELLT